MLHVSKTLPLTKSSLQQLQGNEKQNCRIKTETTVGSRELLAKLRDIAFILRKRMLRLFRHVRHSSGAVRTACDIQVDHDGQGGPR